MKTLRSFCKHSHLYDPYYDPYDASPTALDQLLINKVLHPLNIFILGQMGFMFTLKKITAWLMRGSYETAEQTEIYVLLT